MRDLEVRALRGHQRKSFCFGGFEAKYTAAFPKGQVLVLLGDLAAQPQQLGPLRRTQRSSTFRPQFPSAGAHRAPTSQHAVDER